jgi:hypothetical protein
VTWTEDTQAPLIGATGTTLSLGCNPSAAQIDAALGTATATDNCGAVTPTPSDSTVTSTGCSRSQTRTWTASDACGNAATPASRTVTWTEDTQAPVITCPTNMTVAWTASTSTNDTGVATATDNCDPNPVISYQDTEAPGTCLNTKVITRTWTATDSCGNAINCVQTITVSNTTPPTIHCPTTATVECNSPTDPSATGSATATNSAGAALTAGYTDSSAPGNCPIKTVITRTWTATDACGNTASCAQTINVVDTTKPSLTVPTGLALGCNPVATLPTDASVAAASSANDTCGTTTISATHTDSTTGCVTTRDFTVIAKDACLNEAVAHVVYTWTTDTTGPVITASGTTLTLPCNPSTTEIEAALGTATATDSCSAATVTSADSAVTTSSECGRSQTRTFTATDACNKTSVTSRTVTWKADTTPPSIVCPAAVAVNSDAEVPTPASNYTEFVAQSGIASDDCTIPPTVTHVGDVPSGTNPKTITRTYRATDACGNSATCTQIITVSETDAGGTLFTDTMRCTLPNNQLRLIFSPDPQNAPCYKLTASNPGQFYYNLFYSGTPGEVETFNVTLPYPWITQGAKPVEVYDGVTFNTSGGQTCLTPGKKVFAGSQQVTLSNYGSSPAMGVTTYTLRVSVTVPSTGFVFLAIHLDYGLKATTGYAPNAAGDATACGNTAKILVPNNEPYTFSVSGDAHSSVLVSSYNTFKKNPGVGGLAQSQSTTFSVAGATAKLKDAKGAVLASGVTDQDGWYLLNYKATGKSTSYYVTLTPPSGAGSPQTKSITLKSNGYVEVDYLTP